MRFRLARFLLLAVLAAALTAGLFALRGLSPLSADSREISALVERDQIVWYFRWPLTHLLAQSLHRAAGLSGADCLALLSSIAGALFLVTLFRVARRSPLILTLLASSATLTLIGHVEVYAWPLFALLLVLLEGERCLRGEVSLRRFVSIYLLGCLSHMLLLFYAPAVLWLTIRARRRAQERGEARETDVRDALLTLILSVALVSALALALPSDGLDNNTSRLVPLTMPEIPNSSNQVTLFSAGHVQAMGMFLIMSCPLGLLLVVARMRMIRASDTLTFTSIAAGCGLVFLILWHPDMGWRGDWDLFSHPGLVINVLGWRLWTTQSVPEDQLLAEAQSCRENAQSSST